MQTEGDRTCYRFVITSSALELKENRAYLDLEREKAERKDAELSVAALQRQVVSLKERCAAIQGEIEQYRAITANLRRGVYS